MWSRCFLNGDITRMETLESAIGWTDQEGAFVIDTHRGAGDPAIALQQGDSIAPQDVKLLPETCEG